MAKLGRAGLKQLFVKKIHATAKVGSAAKQDLTINPETKVWARGMSVYCSAMWNMHPGKGVEMGDTLMHVAARALNQQVRHICLPLIGLPLICLHCCVHV